MITNQIDYRWLNNKVKKNPDKGRRPYLFCLALLFVGWFSVPVSISQGVETPEETQLMGIKLRFLAIEGEIKSLWAPILEFPLLRPSVGYDTTLRKFKDKILGLEEELLGLGHKILDIDKTVFAKGRNSLLSSRRLRKKNKDLDSFAETLQLYLDTGQGVYILKAAREFSDLAILENHK